LTNVVDNDFTSSGFDNFAPSFVTVPSSRRRVTYLTGSRRRYRPSRIITSAAPRLSYVVRRPQVVATRRDDSAEVYNDHDARYRFAWAVKDEYGNDYGQEETRDGGVVQGAYNVLLPDGRVQTVTYRDQGNGFEADVSYVGEARYDEGSVVGDVDDN
jgi:hypothetical protein